MSIHDIINLTQTSDPCPWPSRIFVPPPGTDRIANPQASSIWNRTHTHGHPPCLGPEPHAPSPSALPGHRGRTHLSKHLGRTQTNPLALPGASRRPNVSRQVLRRTAQAPRHRKAPVPRPMPASASPRPVRNLPAPNPFSALDRFRKRLGRGTRLRSGLSGTLHSPSRHH